MEDGNKDERKKSRPAAATVGRRAAFRKTRTATVFSLTEGPPKRKVFSLKILKSNGGKKTLNTSSIKNFDELPLFLNAQLVSPCAGHIAVERL